MFAKDLVIPGTPGNDTVVIGLDVSGDLTITIGGVPADLGPLGTSPFDTSFLNSISFDGGGGDDTLTVDFANGDPIPPGGIDYDGGGQTGTPGDSLEVQGGDFTTVTKNFTNTNDGSVDLDGSVIRYEDLEPVLINANTINDAVFNLTAGFDQAVLEDDGGPGNGLSQLRSANGTFETTIFTNPGTSLIVEGNGGADTISMTAVDSNFGANTSLIDAQIIEILATPAGTTTAPSLVLMPQNPFSLA